MTKNFHPGRWDVSKEDRFVKQITPKSEDASRWYGEIIKRAELADYAPMKGMMVIRPYGWLDPDKGKT